MERQHQPVGFEQKPQSVMERISPIAIVRRILESRRHEQKQEKANRVLDEIGELAVHHYN